MDHPRHSLQRTGSEADSGEKKHSELQYRDIGDHPYLHIEACVFVLLGSFQIPFIVKAFHASRENSACAANWIVAHVSYSAEPIHGQSL